MKEEKLLKIQKKINRGATANLYSQAKKTQDPKLIKEMNKIIIANRKSKL